MSILNAKESLRYLAVDADIVAYRCSAACEEEPEDKLHFITLNDNTKEVYNTLISLRAITLNGYDVLLLGTLLIFKLILGKINAKI